MIPALLLAAAMQAAPAAKPPAPARTPCIPLSGGSSTQYTPVDDHTIVVRSFNRWWKLTTTPSNLLTFPSTFLVNDIHGPSELCSRLDFQLSVVDPPGGGREGLIVQEFTTLTPEEGEALRRAAHR